MKLTQHLLFTLIMTIALGLGGEAYARADRVVPVSAEQSLASLLLHHQGKVIYLDFWASWCGPCRKSFPWMNQIQAKLKQRGFMVISVNLDAERELADKFINDNPIGFPVVFDPEGDIASSYQLKGMPSSYIIGRDGKIKYSHVGFFTNRQPQYEQEIIKLLGASNE